MITVTRKFTFEAAHYLPEYGGKCKYEHGHSYKLFVEVSGPIIDGTKISYPGIVCDFSDLKSVVKARIVNVLDHRNLNIVFLGIAPTVENIVKWIVKELKKDFGENLISATLYETENCFATWRKN